MSVYGTWSSGVKNMTLNRKTFCSLPWSSIMILASGDYKICCFTGHEVPGSTESHGVAIDENGQTMNVLTHSIMEAMNSVWHKEIRAAQLNGDRHPACKVCWDRDDAARRQGVKSRSLRYTRTYVQNVEGIKHSPSLIGGHPMIGSAVPETAADWLTSDDGTMKDIMPISLDIRFSNLCNAKCVMCEPLYSNLWYEDHELLFGESQFDAGMKKYNIIKTPKVNGGYTYSSDMPEWRDDPRWWKQLDEMGPNLRHVYITGGEPFVQPMHDKFIERLSEAGYAKNIVVEYDTNLSVINPRILNLLSQFKDVIIRVSVDDVGERYNLIRHPLRFDRLMENLNKLKDYGLDKNVSAVTTCIGIYSLFAPMRLWEQFAPMGYEYHSIRILRSPRAVNIEYLPPSIKEKIIKEYDKCDSIPHTHKTHVSGFLKNTINQVTDEQGTKHLKMYMNYMDGLDRIRGTNWKSTFPEVATLIHDFLTKGP